MIACQKSDKTCWVSALLHRAFVASFNGGGLPSAPIYILMRIEASKADASSGIRVNRTSKRKGHRVAVFENKSYSVKFPLIK